LRSKQRIDPAVAAVGAGCRLAPLPIGIDPLRVVS
jgi:hypothetical protein